MTQGSHSFPAAYLQDLFSAGRSVLDFKESVGKQRLVVFEVSLVHCASPQVVTDRAGLALKALKVQ